MHSGPRGDWLGCGGGVCDPLSLQALSGLHTSEVVQLLRWASSLTAGRWPAARHGGAAAGPQAAARPPAEHSLRHPATSCRSDPAWRPVYGE